jgi:putative drug exporter of the RND superfamily
MTERLARSSSRHPWRVVTTWLVIVVASSAAIVTFLGDVLTSDVETTRQTESTRANELLDRAFPQDRATREREISEVVIVRVGHGRVDDPVPRQRVRALAQELRRAGATAVVAAAGGTPLVSAGGDARALPVALGFDGDDDVPAIYDVVRQLDREPGYEAAITGEWTSDADQGEASTDDLRTGELYFGLPAALVVLMLVFGAVLAGIVPVILALVSIVVALALAALVGQAYDLSIYTVNMLSAMGLALGIDYALFVLSRYREERSRGRTNLDAIGASGATASRAVLFSGMTFVLAMFGLLLVPTTIFRSLAAGAILVGTVTVVAALTLLPAVLALFGDHINALRVPFFGRGAVRAGSEGRFWGAVVRAVMRRPVLSLVAGVCLLLALAAPVVRLETGSQGASALPDRFESKRGYALLNEEFPGQTTQPAEIVVAGAASSPPVRAAIARVEAAIQRHPAFGKPTVEVAAAGDVTRISVPVAGDPVGEPAVHAVRDLRGDLLPRVLAGVEAEALVTGDTAEELDYHEAVQSSVLKVFAFVLGLSLVLLTIAFRSIVVPLTAIALNLLSVCAAYGLLVLVFQEGVGNELFGFEQADNVAAWVPLFLFAVLFGLSMDYQVFLLSRIRERYRLTGDNDGAVLHGVGGTARLITGAALIIIAVFSGFAMGDLIMFQQMGFGVAAALLIDATVVRAVLVPAAMKLLGEHNWYLPAWLSWLPDAHVEGLRPSTAASPARPAVHV